ncbi:GIP [Symbiodinium necroappetens]|uniref:GIP protein n=1 Tax=Symbiodinium necroappetens TaxID=1628268 RepID=A0A812TNL3_9DINO|nr:GIP [Symbiodinium necroappetens]|mmetsp:Transcript_32029/g.76408  ORF Transcript_32029/g.76408 Transcript_32029/m.76408 type:complete len:429 (+) Transcript_32029:55-1341(+)
MAIRPQSLEDWFHFVPTLLDSEGWQVASSRGSDRLLHRRCPWGGHLVRFALKDIAVQGSAPGSHLFVRPEVRDWAMRMSPELNQEMFEVVQQLAPGDAMVRRRGAWRFNRQCGLFFFSLSKETPNTNNLFCFQTLSEMPATMRQTVRRNYPRQGDSALLCQCPSEQMEAVIVGRPSGSGTFSLDFVLRVPSLPVWASSHFETLLESARDMTDWFLNRPGIAEMRRRDVQAYAILTIQSWRRGRPLIPAVAEDVMASEELTTIDAGQRDGLTAWVRYHPRMASSRGFLLSEYLNLFLERIGEPASLHQSIDGQHLLPYQCAIPRDDWDRVREHFQRAYALQKAAYRRSRGGPAAPNLCESHAPRFQDDHSFESLQQRLAESIEIKTVVRKTFIDVDEAAQPEGFGIPRKRCRTASPVSRFCCTDVVYAQ